MNMTYRHSDGSGGHVFYPGVVGEPLWDTDNQKLTLQFEDGATREFSPNATDAAIAYGRIYFRDETFAADAPDGVLYHCTFQPPAP